MFSKFMPVLTQERRAATLAVIILFQALCALFFIGDVIVDLQGGDGLIELHLAIEASVALALVAGVVFLMLELRLVMQRVAAMETGLRAARGEMAELVDSFFDQWSLTPSERDVALMILKGIENEAIADMRGTAPGTVRAQSAKIYAKAGVDGRSQLLSVFLEELFANGMAGDAENGKTGTEKKRAA